MLRGELFAATEALRALVSIVYLALGLSLCDIVLDFASHGCESSLDILALLG